jgi:inorganic triphosphatase YgiF
MEREIKLEVLHPELWQEVLAHPLVQAEEIPEREMHAIYFDSRDGALRAAGIAYRVRREGKDWVATVKLAGSALGGLHERPEWNVPVRKKLPNLRVFSDPELQARLTPFLGLDLVPTIETAFQRRERELSYQDSRILLAADWGEIRAGGQRRAIHEIELELVEGEVADLLQLASALCASLPLCPDDASKLARGLALVQKVPAMQAPESPELRGREGAGTALGRLLLLRAQGILGGLARRQLDDSRALHELRKEVRALRALLRFSKGADPEDRLRGVRNGLAVWFHEQSLRRDLDSLAEHWLGLALKLGMDPVPLQQALTGPHSPARDLRVDARARLAAELLALWAQLLRYPLQDEETLREYSEERLRRMDEHIVFSDPDQVADFHRLRIALKHLRYTLHFLESLWPSKDRKALQKQLAVLLDAAGLIRDAQIAQQQLLHLVTTTSASRELAFSAGVLLGYLEGRREREIRRFRKHWDRLREAERPWD